MVELKLCAHCGNAVEWCECGACGRVWCPACKIMTEFSAPDECDTLDKEREYTAAAWNRRATPPSPSTAQANSVEFGGIKSLEFGGIKPPSTAPIAEDERAAFEAYYQSRATPLRYPDEYFKLVEKVVDGGDIAFEYEHAWMQKHFEVWMGRAALSSRPAGEVELPPLPQPMQVTFERPHGLQQMPYYTADQIRAYGQECARAALAATPAARDKEPPCGS